MPGIMAGKVGLITGGTSGIGLATARKFGAAGASLAVVARDPARGAAAVAEVEEMGGKALFISADLGDPAQVETMVRRTVEHFGRLDFAVNNAIAPPSEIGVLQPVQNIGLEHWNRMMDVGLRAVWLGMKYQIPEMLKLGKGSIVNVSSTAGGRGIPGMGSYVAAKFGLNGLTKVAALELAQQGIRVNAVLPGPVDSPIVNEMEAAQPGCRALITSLVPMGRMGFAEEIAEAIFWLCSDAASFVTGTNFPVDGGALEK